MTYKVQNIFDINSILDNRKILFGIAIILVIFFHMYSQSGIYMCKPFMFGFIGVDMFFFKWLGIMFFFRKKQFENFLSSEIF